MPDIPLTIEDLDIRIRGLSAELDALRRWRSGLENDESFAGLMAGDIQWLGPGSIKVSQLDALAILTGDLTVSGTLTLGSGGKIQDADGSYWDENGLVLRAAGSASDQILFTRSGYDAYAAIRGFIISSKVVSYLEGFSPDGTQELRAALSVTNTRADNYWGLSREGFSPLLLYVYGDGKVVMGALPTSSAGLISGSLWNNSGVVNIV